MCCESLHPFIYFTFADWIIKRFVAAIDCRIIQPEPFVLQLDWILFKLLPDGVAVLFCRVQHLLNPRCGENESTSSPCFYVRGVSPKSQSCVAGFPAGSRRPLLEPASLSLEAWGSRPPSVHTPHSCPPSSSSSNIRCIRDTDSRRTPRGRAGDGSIGSWIERKEGCLEGTAGGWTRLISVGIQSCLFLTSAGSHGAHQDERRELSGGQTGSVRGVDPQQVVGRHVQVMVSMGGGKNTHLSTEGDDGQRP